MKDTNTLSLDQTVDRSIDQITTQTEYWYNKIIEYAMLYGFKVLAAALIFTIGFWLSNRISKWSETAFLRESLDTTIGLYLSRILNVVLKLMVVITAAGVMGVETTSFVALLGAAGLAVGLALQGSLANFAGGVLILVLRPFRVGDYIVAQGEEGVVSAIDIFYTTLTKLDNRRIILPNGPLIGGVIVNTSYEKTRRVDVNVGVAYSSSMDQVETTLLGIAKKHPQVLADPAPFVGVTSYGDSSINIVFRVWCETPYYWDVHFDMYKQTKIAFDTAGISIPFPQRELKIIHQNERSH